LLRLVGPLAQPEQEPVGWFGYDPVHESWFETNKGDDDSIPLYTNPPQRQPLTDEKIGSIVTSEMNEYDIARAIEAAHNIKETK